MQDTTSNLEIAPTIRLSIIFSTFDAHTSLVPKANPLLGLPNETLHGMAMELKWPL